MSAPAQALNRARVLVVEDEPLVAMLIESMLEDAGCVVVATAPSVEAGLAVAAREDLDFAVLDMTLGQESSFAIADVLAERGVPFFFASGYGGGALPAQHAQRQVLGKPFSFADLEKTLATLELS